MNLNRYFYIISSYLTVMYKIGTSAVLVIATLIVVTGIGAMAYSNGDLQFSPKGNYGDSGGTVYPLFTSSTRIYLTDGIDKVRPALTSTNLPSILTDGEFNGNVNSAYAQRIFIGPPINNKNTLAFGKYPTSDDDPIVAFELGTTPSNNYLYNFSIVFSNNIDFTNPASKGKKIVLLGKEFIVGNETNITRLVLYDSDNNKMVLQHGNQILVGPDERSIDGTLVNFVYNLSSIYRITISVSAPDSDNDAIVEGGSFIDPVFGTFKIDFPAMAFPENSQDREIFDIKNSGDNKMTLTMSEHRGYRKTVNWLLSNMQGNPILADSSGNKIKSLEMEKIGISEYVIIGNRDKARFIKVNSILNNSLGYNRDKVILKDVFSGENYMVSIISEGLGTVNINGMTYSINYDNNSIRINYPDSSGNNLIVYPAIQSSKSAQTSFYEPVIIDLANYDGKGLEVSGFVIPNGQGYTTISINRTNQGQFFVNGILVNATNNAIVNAGKLKYEFTFYSNNATKIFLKDVNGSRIVNPAILIFENQDNNEGNGYEVLIVKIEGQGTSSNGVGVEDVERTWNNDALFDEIQMETRENVYRSMDKWGTIVTTNRENSDQYTVKISYNQYASYAKVYAVELV